MPARHDVQWGTFAERVSVSDRAVARVPQGVPLDHAGAVPLAGLTAQQLLAAAGVGEGDIVLIHGATGGVGSFAVQLARLSGAVVIGTASERNYQVLSSWGATAVDYSRDLVEQVLSNAPQGVDVVLDLVGGKALAMTPEVLIEGGRLAGIADAHGIAELSQEHDYRGRYVFVRPDAVGLERLLEVVAAGDLQVDVAARYPLSDAASALEASRSGHTRGKIIITN